MSGTSFQRVKKQIKCSRRNVWDLSKTQRESMRFGASWKKSWPKSARERLRVGAIPKCCQVLQLNSLLFKFSFSKFTFIFTLLLCLSPSFRPPLRTFLFVSPFLPPFDPFPSLLLPRFCLVLCHFFGHFIPPPSAAATDFFRFLFRPVLLYVRNTKFIIELKF